MALPGEDYRSCLGPRPSVPGDAVDGCDDKPLYLINSREFIVRIEQSLVQDDPRFERLKISAKLPLLDVAITENRLLELITLLVTLPYPQSEPSILEDEIKTKVSIVETFINTFIKSTSKYLKLHYYNLNIR